MDRRRKVGLFEEMRAVPELISHDHSGLLVDTTNPGAIVDAVVNLFTDTRLRTSISCAARDEELRQFSWQIVCSTPMQAYSALLNTRAAEVNGAS